MQHIDRSAGTDIGASESSPDREANDKPLILGSSAFTGYRQSVDRNAIASDPRPSRIDIGLAIAGNAAAIAFAFAPWVSYTLDDGSMRHDAGTTTDGVLLVAVGAVAIIALLAALLLKDAATSATSATVAFGASCLGLVIAVSSWIFIDSLDIDQAISSSRPSMDWGVIAATVATMVAILFSFRVMRIARVY